MVVTGCRAGVILLLVLMTACGGHSSLPATSGVIGVPAPVRFVRATETGQLHLTLVTVSTATNAQVDSREVPYNDAQQLFGAELRLPPGRYYLSLEFWVGVSACNGGRAVVALHRTEAFDVVAGQTIEVPLSPDDYNYEQDDDQNGRLNIDELNNEENPCGPGKLTPFGVEATTPEDGDSDVAVDTVVSFVFSDRIDRNSVELADFAVEPPVAGFALEMGDQTLTWVPAEPLAFATTYTATLDGDIQSVSGIVLSGPVQFTFTTEPQPRVVTPPEVVATSPADGDQNVALDSVLQVTFSEPLRESSVDAGDFRVTADAAEVPVASVTVRNEVVELAVQGGLAAGTVYQVQVQTGFEDVEGDAPASPFVWAFRTEDANLPPVAAAGPERNVLVGESVTIDGSGSSDPEGAALTFRWRLVDGPANATAVLNGADTAQVTFSPDVAGDYFIGLIVNDGELDSDEVVVRVSAAPPPPFIPPPPTADAGPDRQVRVGEQAVIDGSGSSKHLLGPDISFEWQIMRRPAGSQAVLVGVDSLTPVLTPDLPGQYRIRIWVRDGINDAVSDDMVIETINSPPVADAGSDQQVNVGDTVQLDGAGSYDVDLDPLTYQWALTAMPSGSSAALDDPAAVRPVFVPDLSGQYTATLVVSDGQADSPADEVVIQVNGAPVADAGADQQVVTGDVVTLDAGGSADPDQDPLSYQWTVVDPDGVSVSLTAETADQQVVSFTAERTGQYTATLVVDDGSLSSAPDTAVVDVQPANSPPVADIVVVGQADVVAVGTSVGFDGSGSSDPEGQALVYRWTLVGQPAGSTAALVDPEAVSSSLIPDVPGEYTVQLVVSDGQAESAPVTVTVTGVDAVAASGPGSSPATAGEGG